MPTFRQIHQHNKPANFSGSSVVVAGFAGDPLFRLSLGQALAMNIGGAGLMAAVFEQDVCVWYWINIVVDTTLGVYVQYMLLQGARRLLKGAACLEYGSYGSPPRWSACFAQAMSWQVFCLLMKIAASAFMLALQEPLVFIGSALLASLDTNPNAKLFVVMVATPLVMNSLQYWLTDSFIKNRASPRYMI
ncbi:hypothetical protein, conserved [Eimeria acervulina]|uniref:Uncharacterized protein n=1 Tax=Eimeria acervulina TaxID=5801 RepID=U6GEX8_EIMAC|nr:hypothetical protein, conserved [Eimeria acervulina]CDI78072.1 hypothetical protein, conserved [Eimeria acervulina]